MDCLVTEIPMVVVDEFEIWKGEFLLKECCVKLADGVDEEDGEDGEGGKDDKGELEVLLNLTTEVNGVKTALLETGSAVFMMVMMMMMLFHIYLRML